MSEEAKTREGTDKGQRLQICLAKVGRSPSALARKVGFSPSTVSRHINGGTEMTTKTIAKSVEAFRDWGLRVPEEFFYVPWHCIGFYAPEKTEYPSVEGAR